MTRRLNVLMLAPYLDDRDVGEAYCAFKWVQAIAPHANVTLLTMQRPNWSDKRSILPNVQTFWCEEPWHYRLTPRLNAMAKLSYGHFYRWAKQTIARMLANGYPIDIAHQLTPFALRHASPLRHFDIPYVLGPKAGSLATPKSLAKATARDPLYMKLRHLDPIRFAADLALRASFRRAAVVMGVAPYVQQRLGDLASDSFVTESELGIDALPSLTNRHGRKGTRLLHIGRGVRSKGLRDTVIALSRLHPALGATLDVAGQGPEVDRAKHLSIQMGVDAQVVFHGQVNRDAIDQLYRRASIFCFPSFREPSGSVIFEAMSHGLPVIGVDVGGPAHVITKETGVLVHPAEPSAFADNIAKAISRLAVNPGRCHLMGQAARARVSELGLWSAKAARMMARYEAALKPQSHAYFQEQKDEFEVTA